MKLQHVPLEFVQQVWAAAAPFIDASNKHNGGDFTTEQARTLVSMGQWLLVVGVDAAQNVGGVVLVSFTNMPNDRVAFVPAVSGVGMGDPAVYAQLAAICKAHGATKIQASVRKSVARLWRKCGFTTANVIMETRI